MGTVLVMLDEVDLLLLSEEQVGVYLAPVSVTNATDDI